MCSVRIEAYGLSKYPSAYGLPSEWRDLCATCRAGLAETLETILEAWQLLEPE